MTAGIAVALLVGVLPSVAQQDHAAHAPAAAAAPAPDASAPAPAPPPAEPDKTDEAKPLTETEFGLVFSDIPTAYQRYLAFDDAKRKDFQTGLRNYLATTDKPEARESRGDWLRRWHDELAATPQPKATEAGEQALRRAGETAGRCSSEVANDPNCKPVPREQPDPKNPPKLEDVTETDRPNVGGPQVPVPDVKFEKEAAPAPNTAYRDLIRNGAFGAMAGALVGIGLLPLLGPMGIIVGAMMGAAVMVVGKKLTG